MSTGPSIERWSMFLEDFAPGLTWLAATLLEWGELPPGARRTWRVSASAARNGEISALTAQNEETGLVAIAARPGMPASLVAEPEKITRLVGDPGTVDLLFEETPLLAVRRLPGFRRCVLVNDASTTARRHPALRQARIDEAAAIEALRVEASAGDDPSPPVEVEGSVQRGHVWILEDASGPTAMFRVDSVARRRIQVADVCIHPRMRGHGLGPTLLESAVSVARDEFARGVVLAVPPDETALRTAARAGFSAVGEIDDVRLA